MQAALQVDTLPTGEIDYDHFGRELQRNCARPAIVNVNVGTTVKVGHCVVLQSCRQHWCGCACMRGCLRACVRACVRACAHLCAVSREASIDCLWCGERSGSCAGSAASAGVQRGLLACRLSDPVIAFRGHCKVLTPLALCLARAMHGLRAGGAGLDQEQV